MQAKRVPFCVLGLVLLSSIVLNKPTLGSGDDLKTITIPQHAPADWTAIRINSKWVGKHVSIEGFLDFDGTGDFPRITLYETEHALQQKRVFYDISMDAVSAGEIIKQTYGSGADNWKVLQGVFVRVDGVFEIQEEGLNYISLGRFVKVLRIAIINNGRVILTLEPKLEDGGGSSGIGVEQRGRASLK